MARRMAKAKPPDPEEDSGDQDEYELEEDNFLEDLRSAVARVRSSSGDALDLREGAWSGGFDGLRVDFND